MIKKMCSVHPQKGLADEAIKGSSVFSFRGDKLLKASPEGVLKYMSRRNAVFLGESHNSKADKILAKNILVELGKIRGDENLAVGLEMVQMPFQNVLDWYVYKAPVSKESDRQLFLATEWRQRWGWNFDNYLPILRYCQLKKIRMLALNVEEEATNRVMSQGLTALTSEERDRLILDKAGFMGESMSSTFPSYVDAVLKPRCVLCAMSPRLCFGFAPCPLPNFCQRVFPDGSFFVCCSFKQHVSMGIFQDDEKVFTNFVSNRILWDETMASTSCRYLARNPDKLLVGLVGGDHVKTGHGIPARIERILENIGFPNSRTASVALNPTWKLYSQSKTLMQLKDLETSMGVNFGRQSGPKPKPADVVAEEKDLSEEGWGAPPRPDHHPFSDIIWYG